MSDTPPYSEATVELVAQVVRDERGCFSEAVAELVLDALAERGLLLLEGAETVEEWRVTGDPGGGFPPYEFVWSPQRNPQLGDSGHEARGFVDLVAAHGGWPDGPHLSRRIVATTPWSAVPPEPKEGA